jgi:hypothetical protein
MNASGRERYSAWLAGRIAALITARADG